MAGPWLYAISEKANTHFEIDGKEVKVSLNSYARYLITGELLTDQEWVIYRNGKNAEVGDDLYIYTGDEDRGIIGYAKIEEPHKNHLKIAIDQQQSISLLKNPIPAETVRRWVFPLQNVINLKDHRTEIARLMGRKK